MSIMALVIALALQDVDPVKGLAHREAYEDAQKEYAKALMFLDGGDPKSALDLIDKIFNNPRISTKDRRLAFQGPGGGVLRTVDFFPHQARGRIELNLAGQVKGDPSSVSKLVGLAIADLKASVDAGVRSSERLLSTAEDLQKKLKPVARAPDPAPKVPPKEPTKDTAAEQGFREAWFRLIEDHRFKSAREYIDVKGSSLAADKKREFIAETETHCQKYVQDAMEGFLTALHNTVRVEGLRQKSDPEYQREFALPSETEVVGSLPALDWCRRERSALDRFRHLEARAPLDQAMPVLEGLLGAMVAADPLEHAEENRWLKESWQMGYRVVEDLIRGLAATSKEAPPDVRRQCRTSAEQIRTRWVEALSRVPRSTLVKNAVHPHPKQLQGLMELFPVDPSDLDKMDLDACFTAESPDLALDQLISDLSRMRKQEGAPLSKESSQKLLTVLVAAIATRDLLAGKGVEEVARGLGEIRQSLTLVNGPVDPGRWGPKIEKILSGSP